MNMLIPNLVGTRPVAGQNTIRAGARTLLAKHKVLTLPTKSLPIGIPVNMQQWNSEKYPGIVACVFPWQEHFHECCAVLFARAVPTFSSAAICGSAMMSAFISLHSSVHRSLGSISLTRLSFFIGNGAGEQPGHTEIWDYNEFQRGRQIRHAFVRDRHVVQLWCKLRIRTGSGTRHAGHTALASQGPCWGPRSS